jgi:mannose-6-phosphate isomerase-like protein (cupin superfamily)
MSLRWILAVSVHHAMAGNDEFTTFWLQSDRGTLARRTDACYRATQSDEGAEHMEERIDRLADLVQTIADERLEYPSTPDPVISSAVLSVPIGEASQWMTHPVPAYLYVLEGTLTVEFEDGRRYEFQEGRAFLQCRTMWHRGRNFGSKPVKFLAVFMGSKSVPYILHPPKEGAGAHWPVASAETASTRLAKMLTGGS